MDRGYFPVFRRIFDSDLWGHHVARDLFIYILGNVTHYPTKLCANYSCVDLLPGQMVAGIHTLSDRNGFSVQQTRTAMTYLISTNRITRESTKRFSIITVCNWEVYREAQTGDQQSKQQSNQQSGNNQVTISQQSGNHIQEVKKLRSKEVKNRSIYFVPPTIEEVSAYCKERGNTIDPKLFVDSNTAKGWVIGKSRTPAKDWKAMVRTWEGNQKGGLFGSGNDRNHGKSGGVGEVKAEPGKYDGLATVIETGD